MKKAFIAMLFVFSIMIVGCDTPPAELDSGDMSEPETTDMEEVGEDPGEEPAATEESEGEESEGEESEG